MSGYLDLECCEVCGNDHEDEITMNSADMVICYDCHFELDCEDMMNEGHLDDC